jgi:hypothetical protein
MISSGKHFKQCEVESLIQFFKGAGASFITSTILFTLFLIVKGVNYFVGSLLMLLLYFIPFNYLGCVFGEVFYQLIKRISGNMGQLLKILLFGALGYLFGFWINSESNSTIHFSYLVLLVTTCGSISFYLARSTNDSLKKSIIIALSAPILLILLFSISTIMEFVLFLIG